MLKLFSICVLVLAITSDYVQASSEIQCKVTERTFWNDPGRSGPNAPEYITVYECTFDGNVVLSNPDTKLSNPPNEKVTIIVGKEIAGLEYLPADIVDAFPNVVNVEFHSNSLKALSKKTFHGLRKAISLNLNHNQISSIDEDTFDDLEQIVMIHLEDNKLTALPSKVFSKLSTLLNLFLSHNQLTSLDAGIFKNNHKLWQLYLNDNKFTTFETGTFDSIRQILLNANEITSLDSDWFKTSVELEEVQLEDNKITEIPLDFLASLSKLRSVDFSRNFITSADFAMFENNKDIRTISFHGIKFTRVLNIDVVDKLPRLQGVNFEINGDSCIIGKYNKDTLNKLKQEVKEYCKTE